MSRHLARILKTSNVRSERRDFVINQVHAWSVQVMTFLIIIYLSLHYPNFPAFTAVIMVVITLSQLTCLALVWRMMDFF